MVTARLTAGALACTLALTARSASGSELVLQAGTKQIGGQAMLEIDHSSTGYSATGYHIDVSPGAGYFVRDRLEVRIGLGLDVWLGAIRQNATGSIWADVGVRYFHEVWGVVVPYAGFAVGPSFLFTNTDDASLSLAFSVPLGVLVPFNEHVALDAGTRFELETVITRGSGTTIRIPIGYLGVQAFF